MRGAGRWTGEGTKSRSVLSSITLEGMTRRSVTRPAQLFLPGILLLTSCRSNVGELPAAAAPWLRERARQEAELAARSTVRHDFQFTDRRAESGIAFESRIVDDAGKAYKKVHYDHGTGLCAADVACTGCAPSCCTVDDMTACETLGDGESCECASCAGDSRCRAAGDP